MRIKSDFITNSSSVAFVVCIPNNVRVLYNDILPLAKSCAKNHKDSVQFTDEQIFEEFENVIESIKFGDSFDANYEGNILWDIVYDMLVDYTSDNNYILGSIEISHECSGYVQGVKEEDIRNFFARNLLQTIEIEVNNE